MYRAATITAICLALVSCKRAAEGIAPGSNTAFKVEKLFTVDGCMVYRFEDDGDLRYFANCGAGGAATMQTHSCGRGCVDHDDVSTQYRDPRA